MHVCLCSCACRLQYLADQTEAEITGHSKSSEPSTGMKANPASKAPPAAAPERWRPKFEVQTQEMVAVKMQAAYRGWATRRALIAAGKLHHFADTLVSTIAITSYRPQVRDKATYQEVALNCGDACDIAHSVNEHWCFGRNRRTGFIGFIPATVSSCHKICSLLPATCSVFPLQDWIFFIRAV